MTANETPDPETARELLWRHNLPEDVIDGALALFAQELAGKIRAHRDHTRGAVQATKVMDFAADLISPEHWARTVPAVVSSPPATDRATLRDRIRRVLAQSDGFDFDSLEPHDYQIQAAALLAVLPDDGRATGLREAADRYEGILAKANTGQDPRYWTAVRDITLGLRRMAEEARQLGPAHVVRILAAHADSLAATIEGFTGSAASALQPGLKRTLDFLKLYKEQLLAGQLSAEMRRLLDQLADDPGGDLIEDYLRHLRGQGPEPDLSELPPEQREAVAGQFEIVKALADRGPELPPLDRDPVARRLGLVDAPAVGARQPDTEAQACPDREPLTGVQCSKPDGHEGSHSDGPGRIWYPVPDDDEDAEPDTGDDHSCAESGCSGEPTTAGGAGGVADETGEARCPAKHGALGRICELPTGHPGLHTGSGVNGSAVWDGDAP